MVKLMQDTAIDGEFQQVVVIGNGPDGVAGRDLKYGQSLKLRQGYLTQTRCRMVGAQHGRLEVGKEDGAIGTTQQPQRHIEKIGRALFLKLFHKGNRLVGQGIEQGNNRTDRKTP